MKLLTGLAIACALSAGSFSAQAFPGKKGEPVIHLDRSMSGVLRDKQFYNSKFTGWGIYNARFENCALTRTNFDGVEGRKARFNDTNFLNFCKFS